ncbi:MAG: hypothetical protein GY950_31995 [bacterium]|nr:hypothetical protein [bacterium]
MSKKMKLRLNDIKVKSFVTTIGSTGNVRAGGTIAVTCELQYTCLHGCSGDTTCPTDGPEPACHLPPSDPQRNTCGRTCPYHSCDPCTVGQCMPT